MNQENAPGHNESLRRLLRKWELSDPLPAAFQAEVWHRISVSARRESAPRVWSSLALWLEHLLARPRLAAGYVALLLIVGLTAGWSQARRETAQWDDRLGWRYVQSVDPYRSPATFEP